MITDMGTLRTRSARIAVTATSAAAITATFLSGSVAIAAPAATPATPDLLLRMFDPPPVTVRGRDLRDVLAPAYEQFPADD